MSDCFTQAECWLAGCVYTPFGHPVTLKLARQMPYGADFRNDDVPYSAWLLRLEVRTLPDTYGKQPRNYDAFDAASGMARLADEPTATASSMRLTGPPEPLPSPLPMPLAAARVIRVPHSLHDFKREVLDFVAWFAAHEALEWFKHDDRIVHDPHTHGEPFVSVPTPR